MVAILLVENVNFVTQTIDLIIFHLKFNLELADFNLEQLRLLEAFLFQFIYLRDEFLILLLQNLVLFLMIEEE